MTKLMEWLTVLVVLLSLYLSQFFDTWMFQIQIFPIVAIGVFGFYSVFTILYRVYTFNDCPEAAAEIQKQINEAKADLTAKGLKF